MFVNKWIYVDFESCFKSVWIGRFLLIWSFDNPYLSINWYNSELEENVWGWDIVG